MSAVEQNVDITSLVFEAERRAERLAGVLRMLIAIALGGIFFVAVAPQDAAPSSVLQRQWIYAVVSMVGYFALGAVAWALARSRFFRRWMVWPLAAGDCLFVLLGLWLSLNNTGMGAALTMGFPSAWLVPVVLAFGALRVDPRVLWVMTGVLVTGLMVLIWGGEATGLPSGDMMSGMATFFAPPPNFMRVAMIAVAGILLAIAVQRSRQLLFRSIREAGRSANLTRYLPPELVQRMAQGDLENLRRGTRQEAAVLFVDIRGFTGLSQDMPDAELAALMTEFRGIILGEVRRAGGIVDKFMGDSAMVVFEGGDAPHRAAAHCLACARQLNVAIADWSEARQARGLAEVRIGIGAHWGTVFSGVIGGAERLEYSVFGDVVNTAARLETLTKTMGQAIIVSRDLVDRAQDMAGWTRLPDVELRGRSGVLSVLGGP